MTPIEEPKEVEIPRGLVAEASAPLPVIQYPDGHTEPAPASSVKAEDIIGLLTSEQIEELEAAKISGQLTPEQIEAINAAQIIGEIVSGQIKGIAAGKLEGFIAGTQIAAETITGGNIKALTLTSGLLAAESVITSKLAAEAVNASKIAANAIIAEKISAGAITTTKLAASAVTAEKMSVVELSAISAKLGAVTAGTITSSIFKGTEEDFEISNSGIQLKLGTTVKTSRSIVWVGEGSNIVRISGSREESKDTLTIRAGGGEGEVGKILLECRHAGPGAISKITLMDGNNSKFIRYAGEELRQTTLDLQENVTLMGEGSISEFLQIQSALKRRFIAGVVKSNGEKNFGDGFTCKKEATGKYKVTYTSKATLTAGVPVVNPITTAFQPDFALRNLTSESFEVQFWNATATTATDCEFSFHVYG